MKIARVLLFGLTLALALPAHTMADTLGNIDTQIVANDTVAVDLDEVNVTALKQMAALRDEPEAATILTQADLEKLNAFSIKGISDAVPNFFMPDYGSRITSTIYVRGIGARMDQPSVGLNVDNVPYMNKDAYDFDIADIAMVEMLRGPQSTMYGRNTMAGVINITTLSPMRYEGWRGMLQGSTRGRVRGNLGWYHRFRPNLGLALTGQFATDPGEFTNRFNGKKLDWERNFGLRAKLHWRPADGLYVQNTAAAGLLRQGGYPYESKETGQIAFNDTCFYKRFTFTDGLTVSHRGDRINCNSITSVQYIDDNMTLDQDFLPQDYFTITQKKRETSVTQDFVIRNADNSGVWSWLGGLFGFYKHLSMQAPVTFKDTGIRELIESHRNESNLSHPVEWYTRSFPLNSDFTVPTWGLSLYHESDFRLGNWTLNAGLRLDYEHSALDYHSYCKTGYHIYKVTDGGREFVRSADIEIDDRGHINRRFTNLLPRVSATYSLPGNHGNVYAKFSKGYKAGGFNTQMFSDVLQQRLMRIMGIGAQYDVDDVVGYKPEQSWNYEIGTHLQLADGRLDIDAAAFYIDCRDQQLTMFPDGTTTGRIMTNAGKTRSLGFETSVSWQVTDNWRIDGSYGLTDARFRKFFNGIKDFKGKFLPYAPRNTLFLQAAWHKELARDVALGADVNFRGTGKIYWNEDNTEVQDFYGLLGSNITLSIKKLTFELWGRNLTGTRYRTFYFVSMGNAFYQRAKGIEGGLTVRITI